MSISLGNALRVYQLVAPYLPDEEMDIRSLAPRLAQRLDAEAYVESLTLLTGYSRKAVEETPEAVLWLTYFMEGLARINLMQLAMFCKTMGLKYV